MAYDGLGRRVQIVEYTGGSVTGTTNFVLCGKQICEARDASYHVSAQYLGYGQTVAGSSYFYTEDHLGSIREMTNSSGTIVYQQSFDPYGQAAIIVNTTAPDFGFADYYVHQRSSLNLTRTRAYNSSLGRFTNRDLLEEMITPNVFQYAQNDPVRRSDPSGLLCETSANCSDFVDCLVKNWACQTSAVDLGNLLFGARNSAMKTGDGFIPEFVAGGQNGQVTRHILGGAGAYLVGQNYLLKLQTGRDITEHTFSAGIRKEENQAEILDDRVAKLVGQQLKYAYTQADEGKSFTDIKSNLRNALIKLLCQ